MGGREPNLRGASPVGRDNRDRLCAARTIGGRKLSLWVEVDAGFPAQIGRPTTMGRAGGDDAQMGDAQGQLGE